MELGDWIVVGILALLPLCVIGWIIAVAAVGDLPD
jgi:hypothetical protein